MPYLIKLTKTQKEQFRKEIMEKLKTLDGDELKKAQKFIEDMKEIQRKKHITHDDFLTIVKAKICQDQYCKKIVQEVMQKNQLEFDLDKAIDDFLKTQKLPKTTPDERLKVLKIGQEQILERTRMLMTEKDGLDPDPKFVGYGEDEIEGIYELYVRCRECKTVFKTFKSGQIFCQPSCRRDWFSKNMKELNEVEQQIEAENNCETWNWERIGKEKFRRVYND